MRLIEVQRAYSSADLPEDTTFAQWVELAGETTAGTVLLRIVDVEESRLLNTRYRRKAGATNVLTFPCEIPLEFADEHVGDIVVCAPVVARESMAQNKPLRAHWAHLVVHGVLHLRGFDHESEVDAMRMECREIELLAELGFANPYE